MFGRGDSFDDLFNELNNMFNSNPFGGRRSMKFDSNKKTGKDENGEWTEETFKSEDGSIIITNFIRTSGMDSDMMNLFKEPKRKYSGAEGLKRELQSAIENEDYELAIKLRDMIKQRENNQETIDKLEEELKEVIQNQNFERAIEIREELRKLKV